MGHTIAKVKVINPRDETKAMELELLMDTGSTYTWIWRKRLEDLGIKPIRRQRFRTIDNRVVERGVGEAVVEYLNRRATTIVVFAEDIDNEVLGLHALEGLGLEVDPVTKKLRETETILAI